MRQRRSALSAAERRAQAERLAQRLLAFLPLRKARRVAVYLANDGELDPAPLVECLWRMGKSVYLPVLHPFAHGRLHFAEYQPGEPLLKNRYGIPEPKPLVHGLCPAHALDLVLTPLVAFDATGNRLGMGGGYYDRSFAFLQTRRSARPFLLGLAYAFQEVGALPAECWDVRLAAIATPAKIHRW